MKRELDEQLVKDFPTLFSDRHKSMQQTLMCFGFECCDGWYTLIREACEKLEPLCKKEFDKYAPLEKWWYDHVRRAIGRTSKVTFIWTALYKLATWLFPDMYSNPLYYYGGPPRASQIKEKYGTLRFYMTHETEEMRDIISVAEEKSAVTCEQCGKPGKLRGSGWYYTACSACAEPQDTDNLEAIERAHKDGDKGEEKNEL